MPKMKTRSGAKKRVRVTPSGKIKHKKQGLRHILTKKAANRKRHLRQKAYIETTGDQRRIKEMLQQ